MKRSLKFLFLFVLCIMLAVPMTAYAKTYDVTETDMTIEIDDSIWYVFTHDNLEDNPELEEIGLTEDDVNDIFDENNAHLYACTVYGDDCYIELVVKRIPEKEEESVNLSILDDEDVLEIAKRIVEEKDVDDYTLYKGEYKFIHLNYTDSDMYFSEYATMMNHDSYIITVRSNTEFDSIMNEEIEKVIDSVEFDIDKSIDSNFEIPSSISGGSLFDGVMGKAIIGGCAGALVGLGTALLRKKMNKKAQTNPEENTNNTDTM